MNNKRLISLTICLILATIPGISSLMLADIASQTDTKAQQHFEKANELHKLADYDAAIAEYNKVLNLSPNSKIAMNAQYWIGQSYFGAGQFDAAISSFQKLLDEYPASTIIPSTKLMIERIQQAKKKKSLFEAVNKGDIGQLKLLISKDTDVNVRDQRGMTLLHLAAINGHTDIAALLINKGANVNARIEEDGMTPLHGAAVSGQAAVVELLLAEDADVNAHARWGRTSLEYAIRNGHLDVVELLISNGANIEARNRWGETPLCKAVIYNQPEIVKLLLKRGAYIDARDYLDYTPLHLAIREPQQDMVELLLVNGAAPWRRRMDFDLIGIAMESGKKKMFNFLIDKNFEHSAVHVAAFCGNLGEVESYLAAGGDINAKDLSQLTLLTCAIFGQRAAVAEFLISKGADINMKGAEGMTALHRAIQRSTDIAGMLLDKGADITITDDYGCTALFYAPWGGNSKDIVEIMLSKGANVNERSGVIPLYGESKCGEGWTPLHMACWYGYKAVVEALIANGADINAKSKNGKTPMSVAKQVAGDIRGYDEQVIELLRKHGAKE